MITVYTNTRHYNARRNYSDSNPIGFNYKQELDFFKFPDHFYFKLFKKTKHQYHNSHLAFPWSKAALFHFFNTVSYGNVPWVTTFESTLPRWGNKSNSDKALNLLAGKACKKLIAMSASARLMQELFLESAPQEIADVIKEKIVLKLPPQNPLIKSMDKKKWPSALTLTFIGADFFRKGGAEVLEVLSEFWKSGENIKLNLISSLDINDYATKASIEDQKRIIELIDQNKTHINFHRRLPNPQVLELLKNSHVGLLPTYAETFGYSVLEAQASGCPVITTDIRALPEINDNSKGWLINVPKLANGNGIIQNKREREEFSEIVKSGLRKAFSELLENSNIAINKGKLSLESIKTNHCPEKHNEFLANIYRTVIER